MNAVWFDNTDYGSWIVGELAYLEQNKTDWGYFASQHNGECPTGSNVWEEWTTSPKQWTTISKLNFSYVSPSTITRTLKSWSQINIDAVFRFFCR